MSHLTPAPAPAAPPRCTFCALRSSWHGRARPFTSWRTAQRHDRSARRSGGVGSARTPAILAATQQERLPPGETRPVGGGLWDRFFSLITGQLGAKLCIGTHAWSADIVASPCKWKWQTAATSYDDEAAAVHTQVQASLPLRHLITPRPQGSPSQSGQILCGKRSAMRCGRACLPPRHISGWSDRDSLLHASPSEAARSCRVRHDACPARSM